MIYIKKKKCIAQPIFIIRLISNNFNNNLMIKLIIIIMNTNK